MADKEYIEREAMDDFKFDLMRRFIVLCFGNDYNKLNLLTIGNQIDEIYEKYRTKPAADVVEVRHGEWFDDHGDDVCSVCGEVYSDEIRFMNRNFKFEYLAYCPNCGAKMGGVGDG